MKLIDAFINAAAVWFVLKAVEVSPTAIYKLLGSTSACDPQKYISEEADVQSGAQCYDSRLGKLEYILSGAGFFDLRLWNRSKKWLLISTVVPFVIFALELASILLGNEVVKCDTSTDPHVVSAPSLVLYGDGPSITTVDDLVAEIRQTGTEFRPCVSELSTLSGVEYLARLCVDVQAMFMPLAIMATVHNNQGGMSLFIENELRNQQQHLLQIWRTPFNNSLTDAAPLGGFIAYSEVLISGRNTLVRNTTSQGIISDETKRRLRADVALMEEELNTSRSIFWEPDGGFGFWWTDAVAFQENSFLVVWALLAHTTRDGIRSAAEMSKVNAIGTLQSFDISCSEDFVLPRTASLSIIAVALVARLLIAAIPTDSVSSVQFALTSAGKIVEEVSSTLAERECSFFMDRERKVCPVK